MSSLTITTLELTTVFLAGLAVVAWRYRSNQGATLFAILQGVSAVWAGLTIVGLRTAPGSLRLRIWGLTSGLSLLVALLWLGFILSYTGRRRWLTARRLGIVSVPLALGAGLYFVLPQWTPLVGDLSQESIGVGTVVAASIGPVGSALGIYVYLVFLVGNLLVVKTVLEGSRLFVGQALAFVAGSLVTIVASFLVILGQPTEGYPLTQVALGVQAVLWGYAVFGQQLLQVVPAVAAIGERAVFDDLDDGIIVVDERTVVRTNPQVEAYLDATDLTGNTLDPILDLMGVDTVDELPTRFEYDRRTFRADASTIRNWQGDPVGQALIVRDISELVAREQRLAVLNRVFRHNVRNDMNVVMGIGDHLERRDDDVSDYGDTLGGIARDLTRISEKALEIDRLFEKPPATDSTDLPELIENAVSPLAEQYPEATIDSTVRVETIRTDSQILGKVVAEVLANALEHGGDTPSVAVTVEPAGEDVELTVVDDGPGIPPSELQPLEEGQETALEHTSSFGLWFVKWGVQSLGGTVDIATGADGTEVTLLVPGSMDLGTETPEKPAEAGFLA